MGELLVLIAVFILVYNFRRLPELGGTFLSSLKAFKKGMNEDEDAQDGRPQKEVKELSDGERKK